jgi:hypothetical protein
MSVRNSIVPLACTAAAAGAVATAPATAQVPWSAPVAAGVPAAEVREPALAFAPNGSAVLRWWERRLRPTGVVRPYFRIATRTPDGTVTTHAPLRGDRVIPVVDRAGRVAVLRERGGSLVVSFGTTEEPLGRTRRVVSYNPIEPSNELPDTGPSIAAGPRGEVAVAWTDSRRDGERYLVRVATGTAARGFGKPITLRASGPRPAYGVTVHYGSRGDLVAVYAAPGGAVEARVRPRRGSLGRPQVLGPRHEILRTVVGTSRDGRFVVAWGTRDVGEGVFDPWVVRAAVRPGGGGRFGPAQVLEPGGAGLVQPDEVALAVAPDGTATAAWRRPVDPAGGPLALMSATAGPDGRFGAPAEIWRGFGFVGNLAARADGASLLAWIELLGAEQRVLAALRPPAAQSFGVPEAVSPIQSASSQYAGTAPVSAFEPRTGRPLVAWPAARTGVPNSAALWLSARGG